MMWGLKPSGDQPINIPHADPKRSYREQSTLLALIAVGLLLVHYIALAHFHVQPGDETVAAVIAHIPREVSIAFLIAAALNFVVEPNTQRRHEDLELAVTQRLTEASEDLNLEVRKNVLRAVFKQNLGDYVVGQIESKLFQPSPYRRSTHIVYALTLITDPSTQKQCVRVEASLRYVEHNPSRAPAKLSVGLASDAPEEFKHHLRVDGIRVQMNPLRPEMTDVRKPDLIKTMIVNGSIFYHDPEVLEMDAGADHMVELNYSRGDYAAGTESHVSRLAVEMLEVFVTHPPELWVRAMSLHPDEPEPLTGVATLKGWRLYGLVPGQGIAITWGPVKSIAAPQTPVAQETPADEATHD